MKRQTNWHHPCIENDTYADIKKKKINEKKGCLNFLYFQFKIN